jgi:hypothetical protein
VEAVAHWLVSVVVVLCFVMLFVRLVFEKWWRACPVFRFSPFGSFLSFMSVWPGCQ